MNKLTFFNGDLYMPRILVCDLCNDKYCESQDFVFVQV